MRTRARRAVFALHEVLLLVLLVPTTTMATQEAPADPSNRKQEAQARFERGLVLANTEQDWEAALAEFLESRKLYPTRSATRNAAIASAELGRPAQAIALYDALLREFSGTLTVEQRQAFEAERRALLTRVGELELRVREPGTNVFVDGEPQKAPPGEPLRIDPGVHTLVIAKDGFETLEQRVTIVAGRRRIVAAELKPLVGIGTVIVAEVNAEPLDVIVDGARVGKVPWRGNLTTGTHSVLLRGSRRGTPPVSIEVKPKEVSTVLLRAVPLDSEVVVAPAPATATVFIDGVFVGNGTWKGWLSSGQHRFDLVAPGYLPFRKDVALAPHERTLVTARLSASAAEPARPSNFYVDAVAGLVLSPGLGGSTDFVCECETDSPAFGWLAAARVGYSVLDHVGIELGGGYLGISKSATRTIVAGTEPGVTGATSEDYRDEVSLAGPFLAVAGSTRHFERIPFTARMAFGLARLDASLENSGTFAASATPIGGGEPFSVTGTLSIPESNQTLLAPFFSTEMRVGYRFGHRLSVDVGFSLMLLLPQEAMRVRRAGTLNAERAVDAGVFRLPDEPAIGPFLALSPSAGIRIDL